MTGGRAEEGTGAGRAMTRRDFTRLSAVAGGMVWAAPRVTTIRFADKIVGSHVTTTTTTEAPPPETTTSTSTSTTTTESTTTTTIGQEGSTTTSTTAPDGTTTTTGPGSSTTTSTVHTGGSTTTTTECKPGNGFGDKNHCHSGPPGQVDKTGDTVAGTNATDPGNGSGASGSSGNGSGGLGSLSFTGADTADLAILGAVAVGVGRALYAFGRRKSRAGDDEPPEGVEPPVVD